MASFRFINAYLVNSATTPPDKEANEIDFIFTSLGQVNFTDGTTNATFSGQDVAGALTIGSTTYYGWITRTTKDNNDHKAFYFWTDSDFTSIADAIASGNQDHDANVADNTGFLLVVDQAWFNQLPWLDQAANLKHVNSASDPVGPNLNQVVPGAPTVVITEDANNDGIIAFTELSGNVDARVSLPGDAAAGDSLVVTDGTTTRTRVLTTTDISAGYWDTSFTPPADHATITVTAHVVTSTGVQGPSASDSAVVDTTGPAAPVVVIREDANNDGWITTAELSGDVDVRIALPAAAVAGNTLSTNAGGTPQLHVLTTTDIANGYVDTTFAPPAEGATITVTSWVIDQFGNPGTSASDSAVRDTLAPAAPVVTITEDANNDGYISGPELSGDVGVTVSVPSGAVAGDVMTVTDGTTTRTIVLSAGDISAQQVLTTFTPPAEGATIAVTAYVTDQHGNQGASGNDSAVRDTTGPGAPVVVITEDANNDGAINAAELSGNVDVMVTLPAGVVPGDVLTVRNGTTYTITLTSGQIEAGEIPVQFAPPAEHGTLTVTAYVTDQRGNQGGTGTDSAVRHAFGPSSPVVVITEDANNDGILSGTELSGNVGVSVALPAEAVAGDVLTVTDGSVTRNFTLTSAQVTAGTVATEFNPPAQGATITARAWVTDQQGNQGTTGSDSATRDTAGPAAPVVVITEDANNNGIISGTELSGDVNVSVALPAGAVAGDTLVVSDGTTQRTFVLTGANITAGAVLTDFPPPAEDSAITVTAYVVDQLGNQGGTGSDTAVLEASGPQAPVVVITEDANNNGIISAAEASGDVDVSVTLPPDAVAGDTLTVTNGSAPQTFVLTSGQVAAGVVTTAFAPPPDHSEIVVSAWVTDSFGNKGGTGTDSAHYDISGPAAPIVVITEDANNDGIIASPELSGDADVRVDLPAGLIAGDVLTVSDGTTVRTVSLTSAQIEAGSVFTTFAQPAEGATLTVTAFVTDHSGNAGGVGMDSALRDTTGPAAPGVVITEDANNDGTIAIAELSGTVEARITLPATAVAGDTITVVMDAQDAGGGVAGTSSISLVLTPAHIAAGSGVVSYAAPPAGGRISVSTFLTDAAGNKGATAIDSAQMEVPAPATAPVYAVDLAGGDRFYSTDAGEAAAMATGTGNVFAGVQFDSLLAGGTHFGAWNQPFTTDWWFGTAGAQPPYECYIPVPAMDGFSASLAPGAGDAYHMYLNGAGITRFATAADAAQLGLENAGYTDFGVQFHTTDGHAFAFDAEGYLIANQANPGVTALVQSLAGTYASTADPGFVDAVELDYLARVQLTGVSHGGAASAADLNAAFGTSFA